MRWPGRMPGEKGLTWRVDEDALRPPGDARPPLAPRPRLPGHVALWFAWFGFFPHTEVWAGAQSSRGR